MKTQHQSSRLTQQEAGAALHGQVRRFTRQGVDAEAAIRIVALDNRMPAEVVVALIEGVKVGDSDVTT